ncbi:MAG: hypothetical protein V3T07_01760 [Myxococcota bacterium]
MPNFSFNVLVPLSGTVANALAGSPFEFVGSDSKVAVALATQLLGVDLEDATITFGAELQLQNGSIPVERTVGAGALIPDNVLVDDVARAGDRLVVELTNRDTTARRVRGIVRILPIG